MKISTFILVIVLLAGAIKTQSIVDVMMGKLQRYRSSWASDQLSNARDIMTGCSAYTSDVSQLAYVLSTAIGESNIRPIKEYRAKEGTSLWNTQNKYWYTGYYGRGYVQLTWDYNYKKFGTLLGVDLLGSPDLALRPDVAGKIICIGMKKGMFTGVGLDNYLGGGKSDWTNARKIINGLDKASEFGDRGKAIANA